MKNKDFEHITPEERKNDPDWNNMNPIERLHAAGVCFGLDGEKITLEEYRNGMSEERKARLDSIREEKRKELAEKRAAAKKWLEEHKIKNIYL